MSTTNSVCFSPINSNRSSSISRVSFSSDPTITPRKKVVVPPSSPKRRWLVKTIMPRHVHPQAVDAELDIRIRRRNALHSTLQSPQWQRSPQRKRDRHVSRTTANNNNNYPPSEANQETKDQFCNLITERHLHNRYLEIADKDGDGEIDTNWETSKDKRFNPVPMLSPKRDPFSATLFPGYEKLYFVQDFKKFQDKKERTQLSVLTSPRWSGRNFVNPAAFSAPPGLRSQAPLNSDIRGALPVVPDLQSIRRRQKNILRSQQHSTWKTTFTPNRFEEPRSHPSHFQSMRATDVKKGLTLSRRGGMPRHEFEKRINHHYHGTYGFGSPSHPSRVKYC